VSGLKGISVLQGGEDVNSLLSLMLDQAQEKAAAANRPGALMASRPRG
jgi:hypothetical protein